MEPSADSGAKVLWIGDLAYWMDETFLYSLFVGTGSLATVKIIRNKATNVSEGYGFVEFTSHEAAEQVLRTYNGSPIPNTDQIFRLNWAAFGVGKASQDGQKFRQSSMPAEDHSIFVGDLAADVTDYVLQENFRQYFPSVRSAKVITDPLTGRSKGYGFVRFGAETERDRALGQMQGHLISSRPIRVSLATAKKHTGATPTPTATGQLPPGSDLDPGNTTLFIGGLSAGVSEDDLRTYFGRFGDIVYTKIPPGKGCGFVQFVTRASAEKAMLEMNGTVLGMSTIRISWGRSSQQRQPTALPQVAAPYPYTGAYGNMEAAAQLAQAYGLGGLPNLDPYAAYYQQAVPADPLAAYQMHQQALPMLSSLGGPGGLPSGLGAPGGPQSGGGGNQVNGNKPYDPLSVVDVSALNQHYLQQHQDALLGGHLRLPIL